MKPGARALGIAESFQGERSTLCGVVATGGGVVDGCGFTTCRVGGLDATEAVLDLWRDVGRPDVRALLLSGVALAWYNVIDLDHLAREVSIPVLAITYEQSEGLGDAIEREFEGEATTRRLERYERLPSRRACSIGSETVYVRAKNDAELDVEEALQSLTLAGGRPEPVRVARVLARAADRFRRTFDEMAED